jgi:hypothetical protein
VNNITYSQMNIAQDIFLPINYKRNKYKLMNEYNKITCEARL